SRGSAPVFPGTPGGAYPDTWRLPLEPAASLSTNERDEFQKMNFAGFSKRNDLIQFLELMAVNNEEETVVLERLHSFRVLVLPVQLAPSLKTITVQDPLSIRRLDETTKYV